MTTIVIPHRITEQMREASGSRLESAGILFCNTAGSGDTVRLLATAYSPFDDADYFVRTEHSISILPEAINRKLAIARQERLSYIQVHSHPGVHYPDFSATDDAGEREMLPTIFRRLPNRVHGSLVLGSTAWAARVHLASTVWVPARILEIGDELRRLDRLDGDLDNRRDRTVRAVGRDGQRSLHELRVGLVGLGGTGSVVAQELAYLGVRDITMVDDDVVVSTNLNRLVGALDTDIGRPKVDVAQERYKDIEKLATVKAIRGNIVDEPVARNILDRDLLFCCTDSTASRGVLNWLSYQYYIPMIDMGVEITSLHGNVADVSGRVQLVGPERPCLQCTKVLDLERFRVEMMTEQEIDRDQYVTGDAVVQPAVVSINATIASLSVTMLLGMTTAVPFRARMQTYYGLKGEVRPAAAGSQPGCPVCASPTALGAGDSKVPIWRRAL